MHRQQLGQQAPAYVRTSLLALLGVLLFQCLGQFACHSVHVAHRLAAHARVQVVGDAQEYAGAAHVGGLKPGILQHVAQGAVREPQQAAQSGEAVRVAAHRVALQRHTPKPLHVRFFNLQGRPVCHPGSRGGARGRGCQP